MRGQPKPLIDRKFGVVSQNEPALGSGLRQVTQRRIGRCQLNPLHQWHVLIGLQRAQPLQGLRRRAG